MDKQLSITESLSQSGLEAIDYLILLIYIAMLICLGFFLNYSRENKSKKKTAANYFLAGNTLTWWAVGASLIAANISTEQFIGMAGTGYADGIAIATYEIMAAIALVLIGKFFLPIMMERQILTVPQFLQERYSRGVGLAFSIFWILLYIFINITTVAWLGSLGIEQIMGLKGTYVSIMGISVSIRTLLTMSLFLIAGIASIQGGMTSVAWSDVMQFVFIIGGGIAVSYYALRAVGDYDDSFLDGCTKLYNFYANEDIGPDVHLHLVTQKSQAPEAFANVPGIAAIVGGIWLSNIAYWAFNQYIIQKGLAAQSIKEAQKGLLFAAFMKIIIPAIVIIPGLCAFYIIKNNDGLYLQNPILNSDEAYPWLIHNYIPTGIKGLALVAIYAAIISSLASMLNSAATIFTMDIYRKSINPKASGEKLVSIGRTFTIFALLVAAIAVNPMLSGRDQAFLYIQEYSGLIFPGIVIVCGFGLLWKRASTLAAIWSAILTVPLGLLLKLGFPETPFILRIGYVFIILSAIFIMLSFINEHVEPSQKIPDMVLNSMKKWSYILGGIAAFLIGAAIFVSIGSLLLPPDATPCNNAIAYLNDIGFEAFYFFGAFIGSCAMLLYSNVFSQMQDRKALIINPSIFKTTRGYTIGAIGICLITLILYIIFW